MKKRSHFIFILLILLIPSIIALSSQKEIGLCKKECSVDKGNAIDICNYKYRQCFISCLKKDKECYYECEFEKKYCLSEIKFRFGSCAKNCNYIEKNITCGIYKLGEIFYEDCKICKCVYDGRINCKRTDFCNYNKVLRNKTLCITNKGLYQQLCNGPYFDIVCSKDNFCLCDGNDSYSCPIDYICLHDFSLSLTRRGHTISGWKTLLGVELGNIGICVKN